MGIQNFPVSLQPIIQQGFLEREFSQALGSRLGYRACADRVDVAVGIGETLTKTRAGLKPSVTTPLAPATNTNFDNGLSPTSWGVEQYTYQYQSLCCYNRFERRHGAGRNCIAVSSKCLRERRTGCSKPRRAQSQRAVRCLSGWQHSYTDDVNQRSSHGNGRRRARFSDDLRQWSSATGQQQQPHDGYHWFQRLFAHFYRG